MQHYNIDFKSSVTYCYTITNTSYMLLEDVDIFERDILEYDIVIVLI